MYFEALHGQFYLISNFVENMLILNDILKSTKTINMVSHKIAN